MANVIIVDYGLGNLKSIENMFKRIGISALISEDSHEIKQADRLVLPGVGHFRKGMENLRRKNLMGILSQKVLLEKVPVLGICLGAQLMTEFSEEGFTSGLGWIEGETVRFSAGDVGNLKIPHMGWANIVKSKDSQLWMGLPDTSRFYHVHSYYLKIKKHDSIIATVNYGFEFTSAYQIDNIFGVQFHPEKSHKYGMQLLENFANV